MQGSATSYNENLIMADAAQSARATVDRIQREIRRAEDVQCASSSLTIIPADIAGGVATESFFLAADGMLHFSRTMAGGGTSDAVLLGGDGLTVQSFVVSGEQVQNDQGLWCTARVTIRLSFSRGDQTTSITASACPRRNQSY